MILRTAARSSCCFHSVANTPYQGGFSCPGRRTSSAYVSLCDKGQRAIVRQLQRTKSTKRHTRCKPVSASNEHDRDDEKEESRKYRRTVFTFQNWAAHRSVKRYSRHVAALFQSRIVRGLLPPLATLAVEAVAVALYETLREVNVAFKHRKRRNRKLDQASMFRTNTSYARWLEARSIWGGITNRCRDIIRQAITFVPPEAPQLVDMYKRWSMAFPKTLMCHLRENEDLKAELKDVLRPEEVKLLMAAKHKPNYILQVLSELVEHSCIVSPERFRMDQNITFMHDALGACERILKTPIPLSYTRHTSRFLVIWLSLMPFTLWKSCHLAMIPASCIIAFLLLGIEEIGVQIEEPFSILPLEAICETIQTNLQEMSEKSAEIKTLIGPVTAFAPASSENGNGSDQQFLRSAGDDRHSFATPDIPHDNNR